MGLTSVALFLFFTGLIFAEPVFAIKILSSGVTLNVSDGTLGWREIPNTKISTVEPCKALGICPAGNFVFVTDAWNSAAFDSNANRLLIFGGGHSDYYGNEIYSFNVDSLTLTRVTNPGQPTAPGSGCPDAIAGGLQPNSRHTYDGLTFIDHLNVFLSVSGAPANQLGCKQDSIWGYDFNLNKWQNKLAVPNSILHSGGGVVTAYDAEEKVVWIIDDYVDPKGNGLFKFQYETGTITRVADLGSINSTYSTGNLFRFTDAAGKKQKWFVFFKPGDGLRYIDIGQSQYTLKNLNPGPMSQTYASMIYYPVRESMVVWQGGSNVHEYSFKNATWKTHTFPSGPGNPVNGAFEKFNYSAKSGIFVLVYSVNQNAWVLRLDP